MKSQCYIPILFTLITLFGCEPKDTDGDGITDEIDKCSDTPFGVEVSEMGCPIQKWEKTFKENSFQKGNSVVQTSDEGYIITGITSNVNNSNYYYINLIKTNENGEKLWEKTFGSKSEGCSVIQTSDGGYIITGQTYSVDYNLSYINLIKTNENGEKLWERTFGGSGYNSGNSVIQTSDGGYIITGDSSSYNSCFINLIKTNGNGEKLWKRTFGGSGYSRGNSVIQSSDGGYIITGQTSYSLGFGTYDIYLIKTNGNGEMLWEKTFGGSREENGYSVVQTYDGGYTISGITYSFGNGLSDIYLVKTNGDGEILWEKTFGGSSSEGGGGDVGKGSMVQTSDGGYIITGSTYSFGNGNSDMYLIKTNKNGELLWEKTFGGSKLDCGNSVFQSSDGGYIITGRSYSFGNTDSDIYLIKTNGNGSIE